MGLNSKEIKVISTAKEKKTNPFKDDVIVDPMGQWKYPGQVTKIPGNDITMKGVNYPVLGVDNLGNEKMMYPGQDYTFPGESVTEYPQMKKGGTKFKKSHKPFDFEERARINEITMQDGGIQTDDGFRTWDLGELEGRPEDKETKKVIESYRKNPDKPVPGGESYNEFLSRIKPAYNKALATLPDKSLIVTHSQVMKGLGLPELKPGQSHSVKVGDKTIHIIRHGDTPQTNKAVRTKDVPLDTKGVEEANRTASNLYGKIQGQIISSPLPRALTTAEIVKNTTNDISMEKGGFYRGGGGAPSPDKALAMLRDGMAHGHPLTEKQIDFFKTLIPEEDQGEVEEYRKGGQGRALKRNKTSKNIKTSINYLMNQNFDIYGQWGKRFYDPDSKFQQGGPMNPNDFTNNVMNNTLDPKKYGQDSAPRINTIANTVAYPQTDAKGRVLDSRTNPWLVKPLTTGQGSLTGIPTQPTFTPQYGIGIPEEEQLKAYLKTYPVKAQGGPVNALNTWAPDFFNPQFLMAMGGESCHKCGGSYMEQGGGLSREEDYGSKKKPYPLVDKSDFAGGHRSYPIPTRADAIDALRLAGLHGRQDVKAKVYEKYPDLKKEFGGDANSLSNFMMKSDNPNGPKFPGETQNDIIDSKKNDFMKFIQKNTMHAIMNEEKGNFMKMYGGAYKQYGGEGSPENDAFWANMYNSNNDLSPNALHINPQMNNGLYPDQRRDLSVERRNPVDMMGHDNNFVASARPEGSLNYQQSPVNKNNNKNYSKRSLEPEVNWGIAGMNAVSSIFEARTAKAQQDKWKTLQGADNQFYSQQGDQGDYDQFGNFRPNKKVPIQFPGYNTSAQVGSNYRYQEGGEYNMTDDQINALREAGADIEFLD